MPGRHTNGVRNLAFFASLMHLTDEAASFAIFLFAVVANCE